MENASFSVNARKARASVQSAIAPRESVFKKRTGKESAGYLGGKWRRRASPWLPGSILRPRQWWAFIRSGSVTFPWLHDHWHIQTGGVMMIVGITERMRLPELSPSSPTPSSSVHCAILYLPLSLPLSLSKALAPSSFMFHLFFSSPLHGATTHTLSTPLFSFNPVLSAACSSLRHIKTPLPVPLF